jgi:hypothetical protein
MAIYSIWSQCQLISGRVWESKGHVFYIIVVTELELERIRTEAIELKARWD